MSQDQTTIACPSCGTEIDVNDILYHQVDEQLKKKYQDELKREQAKFASQSSELEQQRKALEEDKAKQAELLAQQVSQQLKEKEAELTKKLKNAGVSLDLPVLDHIILTSDAYYSFADEGML